MPDNTLNVQLISRATGCSLAVAAEVEALMLQEQPDLARLNKREFTQLAKRCHRTVKNELRH